MNTPIPENLLSRDDILLALAALGEDPKASRVDQVRDLIDAATLPSGERDAVVRGAVDAARQRLDAGPAETRKLPEEPKLGNQRYFSCRAECALDVERFQAECTRDELGVSWQLIPYELGPDVKVQMLTNASLDALRTAVRRVVDGHVMLESLRACRLADNPLDRDALSDRAQNQAASTGRKLPEAEIWPEGAVAKFHLASARGARNAIAFARRDAQNQYIGLYDNEEIDQAIWELVEERRLPANTAGSAVKPLTLVPSGRFITDEQGRKIAEMFQPGDSPAEREAIKSRMVRSFNALPALIGVLLRADKEGGIWQALYNEGITDAYNEALSEAVKALGEEGVASVAHRYELDPEVIRMKIDGAENVNAGAVDPSPTV
ncbi:hypothetical protein R70006_05058 [Paraburkholderia domus]|uniref:hypothetical protein n=1 Tax=Paraburkholderia domus TaxID=2793075 RepID=UPI001B1DC914|nr:hypothetical protein [Paraburkholderia domus]CAE6795605.1 hypothetical protein R70006_05058 [Paraburkholderia domus]